MLNMNCVCIYIDAGNFYHLALKRVNIKETAFDFNKFIEFLSDERDITKEGKRFYVGTVRQRQNDHESDHAIKNQTKLFTELSKSEWVIKTSKLRTRREKLIIDNRVEDFEKFQKQGITEIKFERSREKGIDVKIATDLIAGAVDDKYDVGIIVSSDTDLVPAIDWVRKRKKKVIEYIGFSFPEIRDNNGEILEDAVRPSNNLIGNSDIQRTLVESDIRRFIKNRSHIISLK